MSKDEAIRRHQLCLPGYKDILAHRWYGPVKDKQAEGSKSTERGSRSDNRIVKGFVEQAGFYSSHYAGEVEIDANSHIWPNVPSRRTQGEK